MPYTNIHRGARISPTKVRLVANLIRLKPVEEALSILGTSQRRGAMFIIKALKAAVANAEVAEANTRRLFVSKITVDSGPTIKRFQPKDRGRAHAIKKRTSHITVVVDQF